MKAYQPGNTRYDHNHLDLKPADRRARDITSEYSRKFKKLDRKYAADVVGEGDNGIVGHFEAAQGRFIGGQVVPLVVGAFGEVNKDFEKVLKTHLLNWQQRERMVCLSLLFATATWIEKGVHMLLCYSSFDELWELQ